MPDPTPAPLTDEQFEMALGILNRVWFGPALLAAVIAKATREERERIAVSMATMLSGDRNGCLRKGIDCAACRALDRAIKYVRSACTPDGPPTWTVKNGGHR